MFKHGFPPEWSTFKKLIWLVGSGIAGAASGIWKTVTGTLIHITDALASPVKELSVSIEPQQSGSGDPSPTNIRPITGATGCDIWHTGSNICGGERLKERLVYSMPTGTLNTDAKTFKFSSTIDAPYWIYSYNNYPFKENTRYTFIITCSKSSGSSTNLRILYTDGTNDNLTNIPTSKTMNVFVSDAGKTVRAFTKYTASGTTTLYYEESGIFEGVLTASDFEPYVGTVYPISWETEAGTIYRGNVDIISGDITNECNKDSWDNNSSITLSETGTYCCRYKITSSKASYPPSPYTAEKAEALGFRCNMAKFVSSSTWDVDGQYGYYISNSGGTKNFFFTCPKSFASTANELKAQLQTTPIEICYPLATRTTASIEGTEISTLAGENNIWTDVNGEITIEYLAKG